MKGVFLMKKLVVIFAILTMIVCGAYAEELDLESMSLDELVTLHRRLDAEIKERTACTDESAPFYHGNYVVGQDIKAGTYAFTCTYKTEGHYDMAIYVYENAEAQENYERLNVIGLQVGDTGTFTVRDGNILSVQNGMGEIRQAGGFFVP